ncbi:MAG TPA: hypothetical protein PKH02_02400 [Bacteroidales bacterium]|nr:hypothetical protein [Bacteroidales bacterium]
MFFDKETGILNLDEQVQTRPTFQKIMNDQVVTDEEINEQSQLVISLLKQLERTISPADLKLVEETLAEMSVLYAVSQARQLQDIQH